MRTTASTTTGAELPSVRLRLILSTAVARAIKPGCGFVLIDGLERMSCRTLEEFAVWLREQGLQAIGTRVGTDAPGTIIIDDGEITKENK